MSDQSLAVSRDEYPFEPHFVEVRGGHRMHYIERGEGAPVVMIHGNPSWSFYYRNLVRRLGTDFRAIAVDHIGCGKSDKPADEDYDYSLERRIEDLDHFLAQVAGDDELTLIMHDWGGMIGMAWAVAHPDRVRRLVLMNTAAFHLPDTKRLPFSLWLARNTGVGAFLVKRFNAFSRGASRFCVTHKMSPQVKAGYEAPYEAPGNRIATLRFVQDIPLKPSDPGYDLVSRTERGLADLEDRPILIGWGYKDFVFDEHFLKRWRQIYPEAEFAEYPEAGHYVLEDRSRALSERIEQFLRST